MELRPALVSDASSLAALSIEVWVGTYLRRGVNAVFADHVLGACAPSRFEAVLADPGETLIVSQNEDGIDGFIRLTSDSAAPVSGCSDTEIATLYVQPRHHGKGIGKALLSTGLDHCRGIGVSSAWLATNAENTPAIGFYLAQGFRNVGQTHYRIQDQAYLNEVFSIAL